MKTAINVGIYCRLSRENLKTSSSEVSLSIENQLAMIESYVIAKGWTVSKAYIDDDVSGTTFKRDGFQEMLGDIEDGLINCVVTKDLSAFYKEANG